MKLTSIKFKHILLLALMAAGAIIFFIFYKKELATDTTVIVSSSGEPSSLDFIQNLDNFYIKDQTRDLGFLSERETYDKKIKSIKVYRFSSAYDSMLLEQELFFDFSGKPVKSAHFSRDYTEPAFEYFFYNAAGNLFLDVNIGSNKYDTSYALRNFDERNRITEEIWYNIKRKEFNNFVTRTYKPMGDSALRVGETTYDYDLTTRNVLPYYIWDFNLTISAPAHVQCNSSRIVCQDTTYNSTHEDFYRLEGNRLVSVKNAPSYEYNAQADWVTVKGDGYLVERVFTFYADNEPEVKSAFSYSKAVVLQLDSMMQVLPSTAWKNHNKRHNEISSSMALYNEGKYGKEIELKEAATVDAFTPVLWCLVSEDSGTISGLPGKYVVAGYNTPIKDEDGFNKRCLAVYERVGNVYQLRKQSLNALENFNDYDEDFSYTGFNEVNFSVGFEAGGITVSYSYMRGEADYLYTFRDGDWFLVAYASNHRTCCQFESTSYDYRTQTYTSSVYSTSDDEGADDTAISVHQARPAVYMDSMNVMQYDYNETGLLVK